MQICEHEDVTVLITWKDMPEVFRLGKRLVKPANPNRTGPKRSVVAMFNYID